MSAMSAFVIQVTFIVAITALALEVLRLAKLAPLPRLLASAAVILWMMFWLFRLWNGE